MTDLQLVRADVFTTRLKNLTWSAILPMCCLLAPGCVADPEPESHSPSDSEAESQADETEVDVTAQPRCIGSSRATSTLVVRNLEYVIEQPRVGTCNGNNAYTADFRSLYAGWRASVWIQNNGAWTPFFGGFNTAWNPYSYNDNNSNSAIHLCLDNGSTVYCGWGANWIMGNHYSHAYYGTNYGF